MTPFETRILVVVEETLRDVDTSQPVRDWLSVKIVPEVIAELRGRRSDLDPVAQALKLKPNGKAIAEIAAQSKPVSGRYTGIPGSKLTGLQKVREAAKLSVFDLAEKVDVSTSTIKNWETSKYGASKAKVDALCAALACTHEQLTGVTQ